VEAAGSRSATLTDAVLSRTFEVPISIVESPGIVSAVVGSLT
jgi:hypothetical protein